ncbi:MAG: hypothetical protein PWP31_923 [Clostridia bacterium]|nr:hypothetical protein [Clostridia bacterium]
MPRPTKFRRVEFMPGVNYFKPAGVPLVQLEEVNLAIEELEAVRLKDIEGLEQEECANRMGVSRPTFFRILNSARYKIADALISGKAISISGGCYQLANQKVFCRKCGNEWQQEQQGEACPSCGSADLVYPKNRPGRGRCRHGWRGKE